MNEETFLAGLRELAQEPVPGPLPEQELVVRGRRARRRRAALRTATAAAGTALAVALAVGVPSRYFTAAPPASTPPTPTAPSPSSSQPPLTNGDRISTQWATTAGNLADDPQLLAGLRRRAWDVLYNGVGGGLVGRPAAWTDVRPKPVVRAEDFHVLLAADLGGSRVALVRSMPMKYRETDVTQVIWLAGPAGTPAAALTPADCAGLVLLCPLSLDADGRPLYRRDVRPASVLAATLVGATVTAEANDVDPEGRLRAVGPAVSATEVPGLFRLDEVPDVPYALVARRGGGRTQAMAGPMADVQPLVDDLRRQALAAGLLFPRPGADLRSVPDVLGLALLVREGTLLPLVAGKVRVLHVLAGSARTVVVFAVQAPSGGWAVVPTEYEGVGRTAAISLVDGVVLSPAGDPGSRGYAWHSFWQSGHLRQKATVSDTVAVLGPPGAVTARVDGRAGEVALTLSGRYGEGVVPGARHVRFVEAGGAVVGESDVAPLLRPGRHVVGD